MIRWLVTGPIAAGKSLVTKYLAARGAAVVNADHLGHEVLAQPEVVKEIAAAFSEEVIDDGMVNRKKLGAIVFADQLALEKLNFLTHRRISALAGQRLAELESMGQHQLAVLEAAMYFFFPDPPRVDRSITVSASNAIRQKRLMESRGFEQALVQDIFEAQKELERRCQGADVVLVNDGNQENLYGELDRLLKLDLPANHP